MGYRLLGVGEKMIQSMTWLVVIFAHFIGDYALQSSWMAVEKIEDGYVRFAHAVIWAGCIVAALLYSQIGFNSDAWFLGLVSFWLVSTHYVMDDTSHPNRLTLFFDQGLHLMCALTPWVLFYIWET